MDSDDDREDYQPYRGVPGTIVLMNVFNPLKTEIPKISYEATCHLIRHHLRQASTHYIGICLVGTKETTTSNFASQNIVELVPLSLPNLDDYNKLQKTDISTYGQAQQLIISDALWHCSKMFANCKKLLLSRTILFLTRMDTPPVTSDHNATFNRVIELVESNIEIKIINIANEDYQPHEFYKKFLINVCKSKDITLPKPVWNYKEIEDIMYKQSHRHLTTAQLCFEIGDGFEIGVGVYSLLKSNYQPKNENVHRDTNTILTSVSKLLKESTEETSSNSMSVDKDEGNEPKQLPVLKSELLWAIEYGEEKMYFSDSEKKIMSNPFGPPCLKLLGFKPARIVCKEKWFFKHGYFLYPNENIIEGSTAAFKALHTACMNKSVVAICMLCTRKNARPYIVALSPCRQPLDLDIELGFDVIMLPFMENVRQLLIEDNEECSQVPQGHKLVMKKVINQLFFDYKPQMFENPIVQSKYQAIEAIALGAENIEPFIDTTKRDPEKFQELQEDLFEQIFGPFEVALKRAGTKEIFANNKKAKLDNIDENELNNSITNKKVNAFTVAQLKNILLSKGLPDLPDLKNMRKNELVELVYKYFGSQ